GEWAGRGGGDPGGQPVGLRHGPHPGPVLWAGSLQAGAVAHAAVRSRGGPGASNAAADPARAARVRADGSKKQPQYRMSNKELRITKSLEVTKFQVLGNWTFLVGNSILCRNHRRDCHGTNEAGSPLE